MPDLVSCDVPVAAYAGRNSCRYSVTTDGLIGVDTCLRSRIRTLTKMVRRTDSKQRSAALLVAAGWLRGRVLDGPVLFLGLAPALGVAALFPVGGTPGLGRVAGSSESPDLR
jgi:hypothetical protein